ncbi:hypothetical protein GCM10010520_25680 [Rhizobium viscosum]|uniref:SIR2-like domain-containing protein n=1 Tax=Rhizobium viscosum TaxID=1673 RepID=A0ABR9IJI4_RHIVS|nr:hypothetical protein [Rhizobium viscosum]MBE1503344.1 hypothetical protein [Rhizobium viscosum]
MFTKKTVFVVGAGGSFEVGLPVGSTLKTRIAEKLDVRASGSFEGNPAIVRAVASAAKETSSFGGAVNRLVGAAQAIRGAMPLAISIDNYLNTHSHDSDVVMMGKFGITACILDAEANSTLREYDAAYNMDFANIPDSWHNTFCKMLTENVRLGDLETVFENVAIITFNYDRCIEHYLLTWLIKYMRIPYGEAAEICKRLPIFHPYGQVGLLPWQTTSGSGVRFGEPPTEYNIRQISSQIRTFTERVDDDDMLSAMRDYLSEAERVIFLGFSFGKMNMDLMRTGRDGPRKDVLGTVLQMSNPNKAEADHRIRTTLTGADSGWLVTGMELSSVAANELLNNYWYRLSD